MLPPLIFVYFWLPISKAIFDTIAENEARQKIDATSFGLRFDGNKSAPNYFKLLEKDGRNLLIGARNIVYNITIDTFVVSTAIYWPPLQTDTEMCLKKGKSENDCHNYIRILAKDKSGILICGTNAFKPLCQRYEMKANGSYAMTSQFSAAGITPYDPAHNSTAFFDAEFGALYAGTVSDFGGQDALVSRRQVDILSPDDDLGLRTERNDIKCLNEPNFVGSFSDADHVYFWLRESAVEYMNCGKAVYSRVARVCKNDRGGGRSSAAEFWTSFAKARLNCSLPGEFPFHFDEIAAVASTDFDNDDLVYAVFNTPYSKIRGSAVCAYSMRQVRDIFRNSPFKSQQTPDSNWLPLKRDDHNQSRLGDCAADSRTLSDEILNFARKNSLLDGVVQNHFNSPIIVQTGFKRFTQIVVDRRVLSVDPKLQYDVIFVATDDGKVLKLVNLASSNSVQTVVIEIVQIFNVRATINNMLINKSIKIDDDDRLIVVCDEEVRSVPLFNCHRAISCVGCVRLQDPYCAWDSLSKICVGSSKGFHSGHFLQNVSTGFSHTCLTGEMIDDAAIDNYLDHYVVGQKKINITVHNNKRCACANQHAETSTTHEDWKPVEKVVGVKLASIDHGFTIKTMIMVLVLAICISSLLGVLIGLHLSRYSNLKRMLLCLKFGKQKPGLKLKNNESIHSTGSSLHSTKPFYTKKFSRPSLHQAPINAYEYESPTVSRSETGDVTPTVSTSPVLSSNDANVCNFSTLPKDYKVKKTYL